MCAYQEVNILLFIMKVWDDLNTSSFRLAEPKIKNFREIVSEISKNDQKSFILRYKLTYLAYAITSVYSFLP